MGKEANGKAKLFSSFGTDESSLRNGGQSRICVEEGFEAKHTSLELDSVAARGIKRLSGRAGSGRPV